MTALVLKGMAERRLRSALTAIAILLGVAMIAGTYVLTDQIESAFEDIQESVYEGTDVVVAPRAEFTSSIQAATPFSASVIDRIQRVAGVEKAEGDLYETGSLVVDGERVSSDFAPSVVMATQSEPFNPLTTVEGRRPAAPGEIGVISQTADEQGLQVGDEVQVATRTGVKPATVVQVFEYGGVASVGGANIVTATLPQVQSWFDRRDQVTSVAIEAADGVDPQVLADRVQAVLGSGLEARTGAQTATDTASQINDTIGGFLTPMLLALAGAAVLVGAFIIFNTFSITVAQRTREFALLRAVGSTRRQIVATVTAEAVALGLLASLLGLAAGLGFARLLGALFDSAGMGVPRAGMELAPRTVAIALAVGVGVTLLAALIPAMRATRVAPVQALAGTPPPSQRARRWTPWLAGAVSLLGLASLLNGLFGSGPATARMAAMAGGAVLLFVGLALTARHVVRPVAALAGWPLERAFHTAGRLARENTVRNPGRTATTGSALMVGLGLVVFVAVFAAGLKTTVDDSFSRLVVSDLAVSSESYEPLPADAGPVIDGVPGVGSVTPLFVDQVQVNGEPSDSIHDFANGVDPSQINAVWDFEWVGEGRDGLLARLNGPTALVEEQFALTHGIDVGDEFVVQSATGPRVRVTAIAEYRDPVAMAGFVVGRQMFSRISSLTDPYSYWVSVYPGFRLADVRADVAEALGPFPAARVQTTAEYRDEIAGQLDTMVYMLYALLAMSVVISLFGIANALFLSIHERTREFGLLRAIGATREQVRRIVRYESVITALIGGLLGIAVGLLFGYLMVAALADLGLAFSVPVVQLVAFLAVAVIVGVLAAAVPARRGARVDVLEALRHE